MSACPHSPTNRTATRGIPHKGPGSFDGQLLAFAEDLREEGMAVGTSEMLDAFEALAAHPLDRSRRFKETLAATLAKSPEDRRVFELVFDRFFFRAAEAEAARRQHHRGRPAAAAGGRAQKINLETLRQQIAAALRDGSDAALRDLARLAIAAFGRGEGSGRARRRRAADPPRARASGPSPSRSFPTTIRASRDSRESSCGASSSIFVASSSAT